MPLLACSPMRLRLEWLIMRVSEWSVSLKFDLVQLLMLESERVTYQELKAYDLHPAELFVAVFLGLKDPNTLKTTHFSRTTAGEMVAAMVELIGREEIGPELLKTFVKMFEGKVSL